MNGLRYDTFEPQAKYEYNEMPARRNELELSLKAAKCCISIMVAKTEICLTSLDTVISG